MRILSSLLALLLLTVSAPALHADDGAASVAAGGLVLMKREPRIVMAKEVLKISPTNVTVDYEFRNDSDQNITTVVAFPIPAYQLDGYSYQGDGNGYLTLDDFQLTVDGASKKFETDIRALVGKRDITDLLHSMHIDVASMGHFEFEKDLSEDLVPATPETRRRLIDLGAFSAGSRPEEMEPKWSVEKKYYWTQTFPAHGIVRIEHRYTPGAGGAVTLPLMDPDKDSQELVASFCLDPALKQSLLKTYQNGQGVPYDYVDFILTTANTWKTPIEDFTLIVERPKPDPGTKVLVSFCWNGPVTKTDANHFTAHTTNLIPDKELRIGFLHQ